MPAPVIVFAYNRPVHLKRTLESLSANYLADQTDLYIYIDGTKPNDTAANREMQNEVKRVARLKQWCKNVTVKESKVNKGLATSIIEGVTELVNKHNKIIVLEDDLVSSPFMLEYFNKALIHYESKEDVISISGYVYPLNGNLPETFFIKGADCWGWATWKRGWNLFEANGYKLLCELRDKKLTNEFDFSGSYPFTKMLEDQIVGQNDSWAVRWYASAFLKNKLTLYPSLSLIENIGADGTGTHGDSTTILKTLLRKTPIAVYENEINESALARKSFVDYFKKIENNNTNRSIKSKLTRLIPLGLKKSVKKIIYNTPVSKYGWFGNYKTWSEAQANSHGYNQQSILDRIKQSVLKVKNKQAAFERDSVLFHTLDFQNEILEFLKTAFKQNNKLHLLDFGGSLASSYFQYKNLLPKGELKWAVVEQAHFVDCGKKFIEEFELKFYYTPDEALLVQSPHVLLLASVMQYLEKPYELIESLKKHKFEYIIIDRTGFIESDSDRLTVQHLPEFIYKASYPAWFFNEQKFIEIVKQGYTLQSEFESKFTSPTKVDGFNVYWKGFIFKRNQ